jgi:hypothetical protein
MPDKVRQYFQNPVQISTSFNIPLSLPAGDPRQLNIIHMFCNRTANRMSENFEEDALWKRSIPQLAHTEPAVFHALLAVNLVFEQAEQNKGGPVQQVSPLAIQSYNKAIQCVLRKDSLSNNDVYVSLVVCILFVCLEFMKGDMSLSLQHIQGGFRILTDRNNHVTSTDLVRTSPPGVTDDLISDLSAMLARLRVQALLFDPTLLPQAKRKELAASFSGPMPREFRSLAEARSHFVGIGGEAMALILSTSKTRYCEGSFDEFKPTQTRLTAEILQWRLAFDSLLAREQQSWTWQKVKAANILQMQALSISIWTATALSSEQSLFDLYRAEFQAILDLAVSTVGHGRLSNFQFDLGVIPTLHFVGVKCRWPELRRQALKILGSAHWREMLFDSHRAYRAVHRVMELEEAESGMFILPAEESRILWAHVGIVEPGATSLRHLVAKRPKGGVGPLIVWDEYLPMSGDLPPFEPWIESLTQGY